jgi:eukaryotic-like serine/threonine-protein kinase
MRSDTVRVLAATMQRGPSSTIVPSWSEADESGLRALRAARQSSSALTLHDTIGQGGMGLVRRGTQHTMGRDVAVKTIRQELNDDGAAVKLLREAWVTGLLEHPNVVPVYDVLMDADGWPQILLKRIEGQEWAELIDDAEEVSQRFTANDLLQWNISIVMQVCNAISYAHSKGIVHRDLKPENIMVGSFGEVYVLDWGIAVSLAGDDSGRLPVGSGEIAGTPHYMAPEMLVGEVFEETDIYLLGGILYEVACGEPPHRGETLDEIVASILGPPPDLPTSVPPELATIITTALSRMPDDRYESVDVMRQALQQFLERRSAAALAEQSVARLEQLEETLRNADPSNDSVRLELHSLFSECRFGFQQALQVWQESPRARDGLRRATDAMAHYELQRGDPHAAAALVAQTQAPSIDPALQQSIDAALRAAEADAKEVSELAKVGRLNPKAGRKLQSTTIVLVGIVLAVGAASSGVLVDLVPGRPYLGISLPPLIMLAAFLVVWNRTPKRQWRSLYNRMAAAAVTLAVTAEAILHFGSWLLGLPADVSTILRILLWAVLLSMCAVVLERRYVPASLFLFLAFIGAALSPSHQPWIVAGCMVAMTISSVLISRRDNRRNATGPRQAG